MKQVLNFEEIKAGDILKTTYKDYFIKVTETTVVEGGYNRHRIWGEYYWPMNDLELGLYDMKDCYLAFGETYQFFFVKKFEREPKGFGSL